MKLSDAILLGSTMRPQIHGRLSDGERTCAMGAAYEAAGILDAMMSAKDRDERMALKDSRFPGVCSGERYSCPCEGAAHRAECFGLVGLALHRKAPLMPSSCAAIRVFVQGPLVPIPEKTILHGSKNSPLALRRGNCECCGEVPTVSRGNYRDHDGLLGRHSLLLATRSISGAPSSSSLHAMGPLSASSNHYSLPFCLSVVDPDPDGCNRVLSGRGGLHDS